ncbi:hypothetical protein ONZ45_g19348 [Pleurotus djamor]|nr:hypothetical protein ONZ45_g19348 [Pleurotus djamor]
MFLATFSFAVFAISVAFTAYSRARFRNPISRRNLNGVWTFGLITCLAFVAIIHAGVRISQVGICQDYSILPSSCAFGSMSLALWCLVSLIGVTGGIVSYFHVEPAFKITPYPNGYRATSYSTPAYPQRAYRPGTSRTLGRSVDSERLAGARV